MRLERREIRCERERFGVVVWVSCEARVVEEERNAQNESGSGVRGRPAGNGGSSLPSICRARR